MRASAVTRFVRFRPSSLVVMLAAVVGWSCSGFSCTRKPLKLESSSDTTDARVPLSVTRTAALDASPQSSGSEKGAGSFAHAADAPWTVLPGDDGTFQIMQRGKHVASFSYVFWAEDWKWAGGNDTVRNLKEVGGTITFDLVIDRLGVQIHAKMARSSPSELTIEYAVVTQKALTGIIGGGLEFHLAPAEGEVELLGGKRGLAWRAPNKDGASVEFDPPLEEAYFERNRKDTARCFLIGKKLSQGARTVTLRVKLPPDGIVLPSVPERYGSDGGPDWYLQTLAWDRWPVDVSFLNDRPAGKRGRVKVEQDRLVFEDGSPARFWGTNLQAYALFHGSRADIALQAKRIAALGYNLVRIHHHDSSWVSPNVIAQGTTSQKLDGNALDTLDWWIKCLEDEGVYVWLDLHVGRRFVEGDGIDGYAELAKQNGEGKGFAYVNPRIEQLMAEFGAAYLTRVNRYTGKAYTADPAVIAVLLTNENDLTHHFGNLMLPDKGNPVHQKMFETLATAVAKRTGLPIDESLKTWLPGPSKIVLNELEHAFDTRQIRRLRAVGVQSLVATTSYWGDDPLFSLPALTAGDVIDVHSYGNAESLSTNPRHEANFIDLIGAAQVAGKPLTISEWNVEFPKRDRFVAPLYVAALAALQGWDAPMLYGYLQSGVSKPERADPWSTLDDPAISALMPAAAVMFRQAHVKEANNTYRLDLSRRDLYESGTSPTTSVTIRTLVEQSKLTIGLPDIPELEWDGPRRPPEPGVTVITDPNHDYIPQGQHFVQSDTREIRRDWAQGIETIDTPLSQAAMGWIGGQTIHLADVDLEIRTPKATVAITSLDGTRIASSRRLLLTVVAQAVSRGDGKLPYLVQPVEGTIRVRSAQALRLTELSPNASAAGPARPDQRPTAAPRIDGKSVFTIARGTPTHWFLLTP